MQRFEGLGKLNLDAKVEDIILLLENIIPVATMYKPLNTLEIVEFYSQLLNLPSTELTLKDALTLKQIETAFHIIKIVNVITQLNRKETAILNKIFKNKSGTPTLAELYNVIKYIEVKCEKDCACKKGEK